MNRSEFKSYVDKGKWIVHHMPRNSDFNQSPYDDQVLLQRYGWVETNNSWYPPLPQQRHRNLLYDHCKISKDDQRNRHVIMTHAQWGEAIINRKRVYRWPPTQAVYSCVFNPGAIMALNSTSPEKVREELRGSRIHTNDIVPLRRWSDIVWLQWKQFCGNECYNIQNIRSIVQCDITNKETCDVVQEALRRSAHEQRPFPNPSYSSPQTGPVTFVRDQGDALVDDCFYALMGTANASGPAYFLGQHQRELNDLAIMAITCVYHWELIDKASLSLVFHIARWR